MKVNDVPQDNTVDYYEGVKRACYAINEEGKYVIVPSTGWREEELINRLAVQELADNLEKTRQAVRAGWKSPLAYHMERRQMNPQILGKTAGIAVFRVKRHLRPEIFARLRDPLLQRYAKALAITVAELKTVPQE
ncbi:MAG TPA: hypothetical protein P5040_08785 [Smithella sp.]|nr:hypothetical protein [Smithella sp.]HRS98270.1 hypothetical protein [Smithella sp.]